MLPVSNCSATKWQIGQKPTGTCTRTFRWTFRLTNGLACSLGVSVFLSRASHHHSCGVVFGTLTVSFTSHGASCGSLVPVVSSEVEIFGMYSTTTAIAEYVCGRRDARTSISVIDAFAPIVFACSRKQTATSTARRLTDLIRPLRRCVVEPNTNCKNRRMLPHHSSWFMLNSRSTPVAIPAKPLNR